jgi:hypothetical protein
MCFQGLEFDEWVANGNGPPSKYYNRFLSHLPLKGGNAQVPNARAGREVVALQDAKMKVVACFSEGREFYEGELMCAQTGVLKPGTKGRVEKGAVDQGTVEQAAVDKDPVADKVGGGEVVKEGEKQQSETMERDA